MGSVTTVLKRVFLVLFGFLALTLIAAAAAVAWVWRHPGAAWEVVEGRFLPPDLKIGWERMELDRPEGARGEIRWRVGGLRIRKEEPGIAVDVEDARIVFSLHPFASGPKLVLHEVTAVSGEPISFRPGPSSPDEPATNPLQSLERTLSRWSGLRRWIAIEDVDLRLEDLRLLRDEGGDVRLEIRARQDHRRRPGVLALAGEVRLPGEKPARVRWDGFVHQESLLDDGAFSEGQIWIHGWGIETSPRWVVSRHGREFLVQLDGATVYRSGKTRLSVDSRNRIRLARSEIQLWTSASIRGVPGEFVRVRDLEARVRVPLDPDGLWSADPAEFRVTAPLRIFFVDPDMRPPFEKACRCRLPEVLRASVRGTLRMDRLTLESPAALEILQADLEIESVRNRLLSLDLKGGVGVTREGTRWLFEPRLDTEAVIHSYQGLRGFLDAKNVMIPAPLDVLEGTIRARIRGPVGSSKEGFEIPAELRMDLGSPHQKVLIDADARARVSGDFKKVDLKTKVSIRDLQLELPPLDPIRGIPQIARDRRILLNERKPASEGKPAVKVDFEVEVETARPGAIRLLSDFAEPHIPVSLKIRQKGTRETAGALNLEPFEIQYLRRTVAVEDLRLDLDDAGDGAFPVTGRFAIDQTQYRVFIEIGGTTKAPQIQLSSEPYLPQSEIISVLLYDRTSDQLVGNDAETAGNFQAAVADKAIGLFGLWAFATTPIRSFSYNPVTRVYTATVLLGDGLTAGVGTNWEEATHLELRKRITQRWMLTAAWSPAVEDERSQGKLVLQWERRF